MLIRLPVDAIITLNVIGWPIIQLSIARLTLLIPAERFSAAPAKNTDRQYYECWLGVRRWKNLLPDAAPWLGGTFAKAHLGSVDPDHLLRFIQETRRGEIAHWLMIAATPIFFLWNPLWADVVMMVYALAANLPCIFVQRYNRARLIRLMKKRA